MKESKKTLDIWTNPTGECAKQFAVIHRYIKTWTKRLSAGKLPAKWTCMSYSHQLWAKLRYVLGCNSLLVEELVEQEEAGGPLRQTHQQILPFLGLNRNTKARWCHLHPSFGRIGPRKLLIKVMRGRVNIFVQYYSTPSTLGYTLTTSLEQLQLEADTRGCPLNTPYLPIRPHTTPCCLSN